MELEEKSEDHQSNDSNSPCDPAEDGLNLAWPIARPINTWPVN